MNRRGLIVVAACLAASVVGAGDASGHGTVEQRGGAQPGGLSRLTAEPMPTMVPLTVDLPDEWTCTARTDDNVADALSAGPVVKVVYAYAPDQANRFGEWATTMQRMVERSMNMLANPAHDGSRAPGRTFRFDLGTACNPLEVDIQTVALPRPAADYPRQPASDFARLLLSDIRNQVGPLGQRNVLAVVDGLGDDVPAAGYGHSQEDSRPGDVNPAQLGGRVSVVLPRGGTPSDPFGQGAWRDPIDFPAKVVTHELLHNLGAVSLDAPATSGEGHSNRRGDTMFSGDQNSPACAAYETGYWEVDCGGDSYFNPAPEPGSWLASHWNIVRSVHLCPLERCTVRSRPPAVTIAPPDRVQVGDPATFTANTSDDDGEAVSVSWDLDGDGSYDVSGASATVTFDDTSWRTIVARAVDSGGEIGIAQLGTFANPKPPPPPPPPPPPVSGSGATAQQQPVVTPRALTFRLGGMPRKIKSSVLRRRGITISGTASAAGRIRVIVGVGRRPLVDRSFATRSGRFAARIRLSKRSLRALRRLPATLTVMAGSAEFGTRPSIARIKIVR